MILGIGIDICPVNRIQQILERQGDAFENRVYTRTEREYAKGAARFDRLAARWAAREAAIKALNAPKGLGWHDISVENSQTGAPSLLFKGVALSLAEKLGVNNIMLSMTHAGGLAVAVVILEG
ncbi:MAG: holo-ACP synthase [Deltaproteobacteria bacterium]|nr:holo-ACP synthase [Deltaproteobacteria bacterium]